MSSSTTALLDEFRCHPLLEESPLPISPAADISSISILRTSLLAGLGHTLLPPLPMQHELDDGTLRAAPIAP